MAADQSELNIIPSNHNSPAQLKNGEVVVFGVVVDEVWMGDPLPHTNPLLLIRPKILQTFSINAASKMFQVSFKCVSIAPIMAILDALNVEYLGTKKRTFYLEVLKRR